MGGACPQSSRLPLDANVEELVELLAAAQRVCVMNPPTDVLRLHQVDHAAVDPNAMLLRKGLRRRGKVGAQVLHNLRDVLDAVAAMPRAC